MLAVLLFACLSLARGAEDGSCACGAFDRGSETRVEAQVPFGAAGFQNSGANDGRVRMQFIQGGRMQMGSERGPYPGDGEAPREEIRVKSFWIAETETSVAAFREFVSQTRYQTDAERFGWSFVFEGFLTPEELDNNSSQVVASAPWFTRVEGAYWDRPFGPNHGKANATDPVVHVSWNDALAFCLWNRLRLPTEVEWEYAARGKKQKMGDWDYSWGPKFKEKDQPWRANIWTGEFPTKNSMADGYYGLAPCKTYKSVNGLYEMLGNAWEWTMDDFHGPDHSKRIRSEHQLPLTPTNRITTNKVEKGGSFLCHRSYCFRYRVSARTFSSADSSSGHLGFRCAMEHYK